jgi:hypothetical protein
VVAQALELAQQVAGGGVALVRFLGQAPLLDDPAQGRGQAGRALGQRRGLLAQDGGLGLGAGLAREGALAARHLVHDGAEGELVGAEVHRPARRLLGGHVADGAHHHPRAGHLRGGCAFGAVAPRFGELGQAEVQDAHVAVPGHHHVLGLQVAVDDARLVGAGQAVGDLHRKLEDALGGQRARGQDVAQGTAVHQLHGQEGVAVLGADVVNVHDVRVVEGRGRTGFLLEAGAALVVLGELGGQDLEGDLPLQPRILGAVHLAHAPDAQGTQDLVGPEFRAGGEGHGSLQGAVTARTASTMCRVSPKQLVGRPTFSW